MYLARKYQLGTLQFLYVSYWRRDRRAILRGHPSQEKDLLAICRAKAVFYYSIIVRPWPKFEEPVLLIRRVK